MPVLSSDPRVMAYVQRMIALESGYVDHPNDKGGPTKYGITLKVARKYGFEGSMKNLPQSLAREIYLDSYWVAPRIVEIYPISPDVAWEVFECGVNLGSGTGIKFLQRALNAFNKMGALYPDLTVDGILGSKSLAALKQYFDYRNEKGEAVLLKALNCLQGNYYLELAESRETDESFVFGWINKRIALHN